MIFEFARRTRPHAGIQQKLHAASMKGSTRSHPTSLCAKARQARISSASSQGEASRMVSEVSPAAPAAFAEAKRGEVPLAVADDFFHHVVSMAWQKSRTWIQERRKMPGRETGFVFLGWLAIEQEKFRRRGGRNTGRNGFYSAGA